MCAIATSMASTVSNPEDTNLDIGANLPLSRSPFSHKNASAILIYCQAFPKFIIAHTNFDRHACLLSDRGGRSRKVLAWIGTSYMWISIVNYAQAPQKSCGHMMGAILCWMHDLQRSGKPGHSDCLCSHFSTLSQGSVLRIDKMRRARWRSTASLHSDGEPPIVNIRFRNLGLTLKKNGKKILSGVREMCRLKNIFKRLNLVSFRYLPQNDLTYPCISLRWTAPSSTVATWLCWGQCIDAAPNLCVVLWFEICVVFWTYCHLSLTL